MNAIALVRNAVGMGVIVAAVTFLGGQAAVASPGCYESSCTGLDPSTQGCSDAVTYARMDAENGNLEMRYSEMCNATWARYTPYANGLVGELQATWGGAPVWKSPTVWIEGEESQQFIGKSGNTKWTAMVRGGVTNCIGLRVRFAMPPIAAGASWGSTHSEWNDDFIWGPCA